jgi:trk system potassium uptake protein TrkH
MKYRTREKISNYFDLFILFVELDIFIWVLFEMGHTFRPFVYQVGKILIVLYMVELVFQFLLHPRLKSYMRIYWPLFVSLPALFYAQYKFTSVPETHRLLFIYSKMYLGAIEVILFTKFISKLSRIHDISRFFKMNPAQLIVMSFASIIIIGSFLLYLPYSRPQGEAMRYIDALFTSTSAVCVTGLIVVDTGTAFSRVGQVFLILLIQVGGLGIMTIAAFIQVSLGSQMSLHGRFSTAALLDTQNLRNLYAIIRSIVFITFAIEAVGVLFFFSSFFGRFSSSWEALFYSIFHSVSAFCNAGFSLFSTSFMSARSNTWVNFVLILLIILGGLGFTVLLNLFRRTVYGKNERITVQTRIVILTSLALIVFGAVNIYFFERGSLFSSYEGHERVLSSIFQSVTTRTAGFNTVDIAALDPKTLFLMSILMFIGASPGSTGGGIKTTTFFTLILSIITILRDQRFNTIFKRRIPYQVVNRAIAILVSAMGLVIIGTIMLGFSEQFSFMEVYFETVSAFGTVGLSTGITPLLSDFGKIIVMITMFVGRLGPLTIVLAIRNVQGSRLVTYPEERVMVG